MNVRIQNFSVLNFTFGKHVYEYFDHFLIRPYEISARQNNLEELELNKKTKLDSKEIFKNLRT